MKRKLFLNSIIVLTLLLFTASMAVAECRSGTVAVMNPAGKVICIPEQAIGHIGGPGGNVLPVICPCFSQEDLDLALSEHPDTTCEIVGGICDPSNVVQCGRM